MSPNRLHPGDDLQFFFFLVVEVPSMIVMAIHRLVKGTDAQQLPIWAYRLLGLGLLMTAFLVTSIVVGLSD